MKPIIFGASDGVLRQTIGFRREVVEDSAEQEPFSVTGGLFIPPGQTEGARCHTRAKGMKLPNRLKKKKAAR